MYSYPRKRFTEKLLKDLILALPGPRLLPSMGAESSMSLIHRRLLIKEFWVLVWGLDFQLP